MCRHTYASNYSTNSTKLLSISIVTFDPDLDELRRTLSSLATAISMIGSESSSITIVDNSSNDVLSKLLQREYANLPVRLVQGQGNVGFGRGHNLALCNTGKYHLILNPDVRLNPDALANAIDFMEANKECGLATPYATWPSGERQYLCKRYPSILNLLLRGFAPRNFRTLFNNRLSEYEMRKETQNEIYWNPVIVSGCFMLFKSSILRQLGGFKKEYFLYFEDFDLSLRASLISDIAYVPTIKIIHSGGKTSKKGLHHILLFIRSALIFFRQNGVKFF